MKHHFFSLFLLFLSFSTGIGQSLPPSSPPSRPLDDVLQFVPLLGGAGLTMAGANSRHSFRDLTLIGATAFMAAEGVTRLTKSFRLARRPDHSDRLSFPSGHAARAFLGAEWVRREYGWRCGAAAYAVACGVAALRVHHRRHRWIDVVAGAGIGVLSVEAAHRLLPWERNLLGINEKKEIQMAVVPTYDARHHATGLSCVVVF